MPPALPDIPDHELLRLIGRGAYGEVWLARNVMGVMRAVKIVRRASFSDRRPFDREFAAVKRYEPVSRAAAGLVNVLHAGRAADESLFYYIMELADCEEPGVQASEEPDKYAPCTLRTQIGRMQRMPVAECLEVAVSLAGAVAALHRAGLVHRDVKPSNIIFAGGHAKLADIGLVGDISGSRSYVGTEGYVPPEGPGLPGADLYGLGRVLYEMATGNPASQFPALPPDWAAGESAGAFEFYEVVLKCCEPDAARRYQTAEELLADLALLQSGQSVRQVRQLRGRIAFLKRAALITAGLSCIAGGLAWWQGREAETQRRLVQRAEKAEMEARRNLFSGLVQHARNARRSGDHDARFAALALLEQAAALHAGDSEVREEFIAALATPGLREVSALEAGNAIGAADAGFTRRLLVMEDHSLILHSLQDGTLVRKWNAPDGVAWLLPVGISADARSEYARDNLGRLHSWRDGVEQPPLSVEGTGDCHWSLCGDTAALAWRGDGTATFVPLAGGPRTSWKSNWGFRQNGDAGPVVTPDGKRAVVSVSGGESVGLYSLPDGKLLSTLQSPGSVSYALAISADGSTIAAGFSDGRIGVWRPGLSAACEVMDAGTSYVSTLALSPDGRFMISGTWSGARFLWDLADGARAARVRIPFSTARFSASGTRLLLDSGRRVSLCEFDGALVCRGIALPGGVLLPNSVHLSLHAAAPFLIASSRRQTLLLDAAQPAILRAWNLPLALPNFSPRGDWLYLPSKFLLQRVPIQEKDGRWSAGIPQLLATLPDGSLNALKARDADISAVRDLRGPSWLIFQGGKTSARITDAGSSDSASLSPDGSLIALGQARGQIHVFDSQGTLQKNIPAPGDWPSAKFSPDGSSLLISDGGHLRMLRVRTWDQMWSNSEGGSGMLSRTAEFDPAGRWILVTPEPGTVNLHSAVTGGVAVSLRHPRELEWASFAMSGDGSMLWTADSIRSALWRWDLYALRRFLRERGLDWTDEPLPPALPSKAPPFDDGIFRMLAR